MSTTVLLDGALNDTWSSTTEAADTTPNAFDFTDVTGVEPGSTNTSDPVTIVGFNALATATVTGGSYNINGGGFLTSPAEVAPNDQVRAKGTASASYSTAVNVDVTIGGVMGRYTITTRAADTTPNAFAFTDVSGVAGSSVQTSSTVTIAE